MNSGLWRLLREINVFWIRGNSAVNWNNWTRSFWFTFRVVWMEISRSGIAVIARTYTIKLIRLSMATLSYSMIGCSVMVKAIFVSSGYERSGERVLDSAVGLMLVEFEIS